VKEPASVIVTENMVSDFTRTVERTQAEIEEKRKRMLATNQALKLKPEWQRIKIEKGLIKWEYSNTFNIRVNNFRHGAKGSLASLDSFMHNLNQQEIALRKEANVELARVKQEALEIKQECKAAIHKDIQ